MRRRTGALIGLALLAAPATAGAETRVDLELLLAVDASGSVSDAEFLLQMGGIAAAFRDPRVQGAVAAGPEGRIAAAVMIWSDAQTPKATGDWRILDGAGAAAAFAGEVEAMIARRKSFLGRSGTGIGAAVIEGLRELERNGIDGARRTIDVSGDGAETRIMFGDGAMLPEARERARAAGVTVNGLAILADDPNLGSYYAERVATGPDSFVLVAADFADFGRAILLKLLREIQPAIGSGPAPRDFAALTR